VRLVFPAVGTDEHSAVWIAEATMKQEERVRIELTEEQKKQVKEASGQDVTSLDFTPQELEERIAPKKRW
jgi:hypothetical protein